MDATEIGRRIELLAGIGLVVYGGLFALVELAGGGRAWELVWPLFVMVPGLLLFAGAFLFGRGGGFLAIPGAIIVAAGALLLVTNTSGVWVAWSYLWPLLTPGAVGLGLFVYGVHDGLPGVRRTGAWLGMAGVVLFAVFGAFFELVLGISGPFGPQVARFVWPVALIVAGAWLIAMWSRRA